MTAAYLSNAMVRMFSAFGLPDTAASILNKEVSQWRINTPVKPTKVPPLNALLCRQLDDFFYPSADTRLLNTAMEDWRCLPWCVGAEGKAAKIGVVEFIGPDGVATCDMCRTGVMFQGANYFYPWHKHAAEEFYLPISGSAVWLAEGKEPTTVIPMSKLVRHTSWQAHAMQTDIEPLLAFWLWLGDLSFDRYTMCPPPNLKRRH